MTDSPAAETPRRARWPWLLAALTVVWISLVRVPIVLNAETHLDSDLAVDGLAVGQVVHGQWLWHFPGTPHIGSASFVFAAPQMLWAGMNAITLASGGVALYAALVLAVFVLAWVAFGGRVACWSLVPLAFASTGLVWLAGRLNSGHLLAAAWHAGALALFYRLLERGGALRAAGLGAWCGLGLWHDSMFWITIAALVPVGCLAWLIAGPSRRGLVCALAFAAGFAAGLVPREIGRRVDPYDAYQEQFEPLLQADVLLGHTEILALQCVPRLVAGHLLTGWSLPTEPPVAAIAGEHTSRRGDDAGALPLVVAWAATVLSLGAFCAGLAALATPGPAARTLPQLSVRAAILLSSAGVCAGFILNRNIFNSDNYRYIIYLVVPWALGFGLVMDRLAHRGPGGRALAVMLSLALAVFMTLDTAVWYRGFGWIDGSGRPVRNAVNDPALEWLEAHPEVTSLTGGYWDVYRLSFLTGGRVRGVPYPIYPNRFPEWSRERPQALLARPVPEAEYFRRQAMQEGAQPVLRRPDMAIYTWPGRTSRGDR